MTSVSSENGRLAFAMGGLAFVMALVVAASGAIAAPPASSPDPVPSAIAAAQPALSGKVDAQRRATLAKLMRTMTAAQTHNSQDVAPLGIVPTASAHSDLPQLVTYAANPERFEALGGAPIATKDPNYYIIADSDDAPNKGGMTAIMPGSEAYWQHAVVWNTKLTHGRYIDIVTREFAHAGLRLYVNGVLAQAGRAGFATNAASGANFTHFDLGAIGDYEIGIELSGAIRFNGVRIEADARLSKPQRADTSTILFLGDSYTQGVVANTTTRGESLASMIGRYLGGKNVVTAGLSGSSVATRNGVEPAIDYYGDFVRPVIGPAIDPDMIVIAWGYNDPGSAAPTVAGLQAIWTRVRADYPRALIVVVGMWTAPLQPLRVLQNREEAIRAQFRAWADPFSIFVRSAYAPGGAGNNRWMFGTGRSGAPTKDGINDYIVNPDGNHLTDGYDNGNGQWYVATKIRDAIVEGVNGLGAAYNPGRTTIPRWPLQMKVTGGSVPAASVGSPYLLSLMTTGGAVARTFSVLSGSLPPGLSLQAQAGHVTGRPTAAGSYDFTIRADDGVSHVDRALTIAVN